MNSEQPIVDLIELPVLTRSRTPFGGLADMDCVLKKCCKKYKKGKRCKNCPDR